MPKCAVVVEDEWPVRFLIVAWLEEAGWSVADFALGNEAIDYLRSKPDVDLLITDVGLHGKLTGWDVAEQYRARRQQIAVIYCSASPSDPSRQVSQSSFIAKPCEREVLLGYVDKLTS